MKIPNNVTKKVFKETDNGINIVSAKSKKSLFKKLDIFEVKESGRCTTSERL